MIPNKLLFKMGPEISIASLDSLVNGLKNTFKQKINNINIVKIKKLPQKCYTVNRTQYNAICLLEHFIEHKKIVLILIAHDIYAKHLNFVFGTATFRKGAIVSTHRLQNDPEFIKKELIHELGHVFGLQHCKLPCVMTFSNSVYEAKQKSSEFCDTCQKQLHQHSI